MARPVRKGFHMRVPRISAYFLCGVVLMPVCAGCLSSGTPRRHPLPRRTADRSAANPPTSPALAAGESATSQTPANPPAPLPTPAANSTPAPAPAPTSVSPAALPVTAPGAQSAAPVSPVGSGLSQVRLLYSQAAE